jgi:hypothetical protein
MKYVSSKIEHSLIIKLIIQNPVRSRHAACLSLAIHGTLLANLQNSFDAAPMKFFGGRVENGRPQRQHLSRC